MHLQPKSVKLTSPSTPKLRKEERVKIPCIIGTFIVIALFLALLGSLVSKKDLEKMIRVLVPYSITSLILISFGSILLMLCVMMGNAIIL